MRGCGQEVRISYLGMMLGGVNLGGSIIVQTSPQSLLCISNLLRRVGPVARSLPLLFHFSRAVMLASVT